MENLLHHGANGSVIIEERLHKVQIASNVLEEHETWIRIVYFEE